MAEQARVEIEERFSQMVLAANNGDFEIFASYHTENCSVMYQGEPTYRGRQAIAERLRGLFSDLSVNETALEEINYFELLNDNTAYTTVFTNCVNQTGQTVARYRLTLLWRNIGQEWFVDRKVLNHRELTAKDRARKETEAQIKVLYDALSRLDETGFLQVYSDEATWLFHGQENITGMEDGFAAFSEKIPTNTSLVLDEIFYFDMFGDDVAYTNAYVSQVDENGKTFGRIRVCFLWKKIDGRWLITRHTSNHVPLK